AGADGFLSKNSDEQELKVAIDRIMNNHKYLSHAMQQQSIEKIINSNVNVRYGLNVLSNREMEIMNLLMQGASTSEIGSQLYLQVSTVSTHKMKILKKLQVRNVIEMIAYVKSILRLS
ncbi:MAG: response regulator transcription factor, partial [Dyadobacter sp.]